MQIDPIRDFFTSFNDLYQPLTALTNFAWWFERWGISEFNFCCHPNRCFRQILSEASEQILKKNYLLNVAVQELFYKNFFIRTNIFSFEN